MLFKSLVFSQASGSTGGLVYSRNAGGMYVRSRAKPTNPNTEPQQAVRDAMRNAVFAWSNTLTQDQRDVWNTYAFNTPTWNRLGEPTTKTGQQMFIRGAIPRLQASLPIPDDGPTSFDLGDFTPIVTVAASEADQGIDVNFTDTDDWAHELLAGLLVYQSRPQNPTRTYSKGPYLLATSILGSNLTPPTSPASFTSLYPIVAGQKLFLKFNATRVDGRFTTAQILPVIVGA